MTSEISLASTWFQNLVNEALEERGFQRVEEGTASPHYTHKTCPSVEFRFILTKLSTDLWTCSGIWTHKDVSQCITLHTLRKLNRCFEREIKIQIIDELVIPCLYSCQTHLYLDPLDGPLTLPPEVWLKIMSYLPAASLCSLAVVHPHMQTLTSESRLWETLFKIDFPLAKPSVKLIANWKELYKTEYLAGRAIHRRHAVFPTFILPRQFDDWMTNYKRYKYVGNYPCTNTNTAWRRSMPVWR